MQLLVEKTPLRKKVDPSLFYENLEEMLDKSQPEAVIVYEPIYDHLRVVEACASRGIQCSGGKTSCRKYETCQPYGRTCAEEWYIVVD